MHKGKRWHCPGAGTCNSVNSCLGERPILTHVNPFLQGSSKLTTTHLSSWRTFAILSLTWTLTRTTIWAGKAGTMMLRWLRRHAQRSKQWCQNGEGASRRVPDTSVRGSRSYHAETKSKPACLHRRGAREKSGILNINTPIFLTLPQEQV